MNWAFRVWMKKWAIKGVQASLAYGVVYAARHGVPPEVTERAVAVIGPHTEELATAAVAGLFLGIDLVRSKSGFQKRLPDGSNS